MKKQSLILPTTQRQGRLVLTLVASLVFHGSLVGVAALWPRRTPPEPPKYGPTVFFPEDGGYTPINTPEPSTPDPAKAELPLPPAPTPDAVDDSTPPPAPEEVMIEPTSPAPTVRPMVVPTRTRSVNPSTTNRLAASGPAAPGSSSPRTGAPVGSGHPGTAARWNVLSKPAYPMSLRAAKVQGSGTVRITTDGSGRVVEASMVQSTGSSVLDDNTCRHARAFWTGPANATTSVPITYQVR